MRTIIFFMIALGMVLPDRLHAQLKIEASAAKWETSDCEAVFDNDTIHLINKSGRSAMLWLNNTNFRNGTVELDLKGKDVKGQSFVGIAFHALDNDHYDAVYFRPFNFRNPERKTHSIQYIDKPDNGWDLLREKYPGKYESEILPVPDPDGWFHARIVINYPAIKVYVNGSPEPTFNIKKISERQDGKLGLWIDSKEGWFRNVLVTPTDQ